MKCRVVHLLHHHVPKMAKGLHLHLKPERPRGSLLATMVARTMLLLELHAALPEERLAYWPDKLSVPEWKKPSITLPTNSFGSPIKFLIPFCYCLLNSKF